MKRIKKLLIRQAIPPIPKPTPEAKNPIKHPIKPITSPIQRGNVIAIITIFKIVLLEEDLFFGSSFLQEEMKLTYPFRVHKLVFASYHSPVESDFKHVISL